MGLHVADRVAIVPPETSDNAEYLRTQANKLGSSVGVVNRTTPHPLFSVATAWLSLIGTPRSRTGVLPVVVKPLNENITRKLADGLSKRSVAHGVASHDIDVIWVQGHGSYRLPWRAFGAAKV